MSNDEKKGDFYYLNSLSPNEINDKNPIIELIESLSEVNSIIKNKIPYLIKLIYINKDIIHGILYEYQKFIYLDSILIDNNLFNYFYIILLLDYNIYMIHYSFSFEFIIKINNELKNKKNNNNIFTNIIISRLIIELVDNYRQLENYDEEKEEEELGIIKNDNLTEYNNNLKELEKLDITIDENIIKEGKIDKIYIDIVIKLIEKNKINNYDILVQLDLKNIDLTKTMFDELSNIFIDNNIINKYKINEQKDLSDNNIINFYYILFKYILKNQIYIYHIPFLRQMKKTIIKIIKSDEFQISNVKDDLKQKLGEIINFITNSKYYFNKYLNNNKNNIIGSSIGNPYTIQTTNTIGELSKEDFEILKFEKIIEKQEKVCDSAEFIKEMTNGIFLIGGEKNYFNIYNDKFEFICSKPK